MFSDGLTFENFMFFRQKNLTSKKGKKLKTILSIDTHCTENLLPLVTLQNLCTFFQETYLFFFFKKKQNRIFKKSYCFSHILRIFGYSLVKQNILSESVSSDVEHRTLSHAKKCQVKKTFALSGLLSFHISNIGKK